MSTRKLPQIIADEFIRFLNDDKVWGKEGLYIDDFDEEYHIKHISDESQVAFARVPGAMLEWDRLDGSLGWQGAGDPPADMPDTVYELYQKWAKDQKVTTVVLEVENDRLCSVLETLRLGMKGVKIVTRSGL